jgi:hypothetical protein
MRGLGADPRLLALTDNPPVAVAFEAAGKRNLVSDPQASILAENLRVLSKFDFATAARPTGLIGRNKDWRLHAEELADSIEAALVDGSTLPLRLEGGSADATFCVLRLMADADADGRPGRDALGAPVSGRRASRPGDLAAGRPGSCRGRRCSSSWSSCSFSPS